MNDAAAWTIVVGTPLLVALAACFVRGARALVAWTLFVVTVSVFVWLLLAIGCGTDNGSAAKYARCDQGFPKLPLVGAAVAVLGVGFGLLTRRVGIARVALAVGLLPSMVAAFITGA